MRRDKIERLVSALRAIPQDGTPYRVPGDGEFVWSFSYWLEPAEELLESEHYDGPPLPDGYCGSVGCAAGLAQLMGIAHGHEVGDMADALGIDWSEAEAIFRQPRATYGVDWDDVTPEMVADKLEEMLRCGT